MKKLIPLALSICICSAAFAEEDNSREKMVSGCLEIAVEKIAAQQSGGKKLLRNGGAVCLLAAAAVGPLGCLVGGTTSALVTWRSGVGGGGVADVLGILLASQPEVIQQDSNGTYLESTGYRHYVNPSFFEVVTHGQNGLTKTEKYLSRRFALDGENFDLGVLQGVVAKLSKNQRLCPKGKIVSTSEFRRRLMTEMVDLGFTPKEPKARTINEISKLTKEKYEAEEAATEAQP